MQQLQQRDLERSNVASRNEQIQHDHHRYVVSRDHTYTSRSEKEFKDRNVYTQDRLKLATMDVDCEELHETTVPLVVLGDIMVIIDINDI